MIKERNVKYAPTISSLPNGPESLLGFNGFPDNPKISTLKKYW